MNLLLNNVHNYSINIYSDSHLAFIQAHRSTEECWRMLKTSIQIKLYHNFKLQRFTIVHLYCSLMMIIDQLCKRQKVSSFETKQLGISCKLHEVGRVCDLEGIGIHIKIYLLSWLTILTLVTNYLLILWEKIKVSILFHLD